MIIAFPRLFDSDSDPDSDSDSVVGNGKERLEIFPVIADAGKAGRWFGEPKAVWWAVDRVPGGKLEAVGRALGIHHYNFVRQIVLSEDHIDPVDTARLTRHQRKTPLAIIEDRESIYRTSRIEYRRQRHSRPLVSVKLVIVAARYLEINESHQPSLETHHLTRRFNGTKERVIRVCHDDDARDLISGPHPGGDVLLAVFGLPCRLFAQSVAEGLERRHPGLLRPNARGDSYSNNRNRQCCFMHRG